MIRAFLQFCCVFMIAVGAGSFSYGCYLEPPLQPFDPGAFARQFDLQAERTRSAISAAKAIGTGLMTLGALGLVVPCVNAVIARRRLRESATPFDVIPVKAPRTDGAVPAAN
jgi:hypothetical protein